MTYGTFDLTEHTQLSIRGTTGTHPDSEFVFGVYISNEMDNTGLRVAPDISAYSDMDWKCAVCIAEWIMKWENGAPDVTFYNSFNHTMFTVLVDREDGNVKVALMVTIEYPGFGSGKMIARVADGCDWERAVQMAKWVLEWDERFRLAKELDTTVGIISEFRDTYSKIDEWGGKWMEKEEKE